MSSCLSFKSFVSGEHTIRLAVRAPGKQTNARDYLRSLSCNESLVKRVFEPIIISALNESPDGVSAEYARAVLSTALLGGKGAHRMGIADVTLAELIGGTALRATAKTMPEPVALKNLSRAVVVRERRATFSTSVGSCAVRPGTCTHLNNLFLAGDWVFTHWPATIESAVRRSRKYPSLLI